VFGGWTLTLIHPAVLSIFVIAPLGVVLRNRIVKRRTPPSCACDGPAARIIMGGSWIEFENAAFEKLMKELNPTQPDRYGLLNF
jgi:hypothetical protein